MVRHKKRSSKRFVVLRMGTGLPLLTLADNTVVKQDVQSVDFDNEIWLSSSDIQISLRGATPGEGPIMVGFAHGDYTVAEINEWYTSTNFLSADMVEQEQGRRKCRDIGTLAVIASSESLNDGKAIRVKIGIKIQSGQNLSFWARNSSGASLTTGSVIEFNGKLYGTWL